MNQKILKLFVANEISLFSNIIKDIIDHKKLGRISSVEININSYMPDWHPYESYKEYYVGKKELGGGVVLTEIHEIDFINWLFGKPDKYGH